MKTFMGVIKILLQLALIGGFFYYSYKQQLERAAILFVLLCHFVDRDMINELKNKIRHLENNLWRVAHGENIKDYEKEE